MTEITREQMRRFVKLFSGYTKAFGRFDVKKTADSGKVEGKALTVRRPITAEDVEGHFTGKGGIGIIPLRDDDASVAFAAIDVDVKEFPSVNPEAVARDCFSRNLPVTVCRSKSGGCHLYFFFSEPYASAKAVMGYLHTMAADLGFGGAEVFPKQSSRASETDTGNWINMPYEGGENTVRYALSDEGERLTFEEFLTFAEARRITELEVFGSKAGVQGGDFADGPPCLQRIRANGGFPDGTRNDGMASVAVYCKKAFGDNWESKFSELNATMCSPALPPGELMALAKSINKKEYSYKCKTSPLKPNCDKRLCMQRQFGIGVAAEGHGVDIENITKYESESPTWGLSIAGHRVEMDTYTLMNNAAFNKLMVDRFNIWPPAIPPGRWQQYMAPLIANCDVIVSPEEVSHSVQFRLWFENWLTGTSQAKAPEEMLMGKPYRADGNVYFLSESLRKKLDQDRFEYKSMQQVWSYLKEMGGEQQEAKRLGGLVKKPWYVPDIYGNNEIAPEVLPPVDELEQTENF